MSWDLCPCSLGARPTGLCPGALGDEGKGGGVCSPEQSLGSLASRVEKGGLVGAGGVGCEGGAERTLSSEWPGPHVTNKDRGEKCAAQCPE